MPKTIGVFYRTTTNNLGDVIIGDSVIRLLIRLSRFERPGERPNICKWNIWETDKQEIRSRVKQCDAIVFPGGGFNGSKHGRRVLKIVRVAHDYGDIPVFLNAIECKTHDPDPTNEDILQKIFNKPNVLQITTRGSTEQVQQYLNTEKKYPVKQVFDPALWSNITYDTHKDPDSDIIGVGLIRPEIFKEYEDILEEDEVERMYLDLLRGLDAKGYPWKLFCNGMSQDHDYGMYLLEKLGTPTGTLMPVPDRPKQLMEDISSFKAVIAPRMHANIVATSMDIPTVALVWNEKMLSFAGMIGREPYYITGREHLLDADRTLALLDDSMAHPYRKLPRRKKEDETLISLRHILTQ